MNKKIKYLLPVLPVTAIVPVAFIATACANGQEDQGVDATKVTITLDGNELKDQTEFDIKTTKKLELKAKVEPAEANQDVTFQIVDQEGTGNIACSQTGILYTNGCVGTITVRAISKAKNKLASNDIELVFWNSEEISFYIAKSKEGEEEKELAYCTCATNYTETIEELVIPSSVSVDGVVYPVGGTGYGGFSGCANLWYARLPKQDSYFKYLTAYSFYQCSALKKISIPDTLTWIDSGTFSNCTSLQEVEMGNKVSVISNAAFLNCSNLTDMTLPASLTYIGAEAFRQCTSITSINIPAAVEVIGEAAFANCWRSHITVDEDSKYFMSDNKALYNKSKTRLLQCQYDYSPKSNEDVYSIDDSIQKIDARAFEYCSNIQWISFSDTSKCTSIGERCFALCTNLTHCILPTNITEIKANCFSYCWDLVEIDIPESVGIIQKHAFYGCDNLSKVNFLGDSDEAITWTVSNISSEPPMTNIDVNTHWYSKLQEEKPLLTPEAQKALNASNLRGVGYYEDPESEQPTWVGGYANCLWVKNDITINPTVPMGSEDITYDPQNPKTVNYGSSTITLKIIFNKSFPEGTATHYKMALFDETNKQITDSVDLFGTAGETVAFPLTFKTALFHKTSLISAIIWQVTES